MSGRRAITGCTLSPRRSSAGRRRCSRCFWIPAVMIRVHAGWRIWPRPAACAFTMPTQRASMGWRKARAPRRSRLCRDATRPVRWKSAESAPNRRCCWCLDGVAGPAQPVPVCGCGRDGVHAVIAPRTGRSASTHRAQSRFRRSGKRALYLRHQLGTCAQRPER